MEAPSLFLDDQDLWISQAMKGTLYEALRQSHVTQNYAQGQLGSQPASGSP